MFRRYNDVVFAVDDDYDGDDDDVDDVDDVDDGDDNRKSTMIR